LGLRILLQCLYYPPEVGGLESHVAGLAAKLAAAGHDVYMLTSRSRPGLARHERVDGVSVHRVWMPGRSPAAWAAHIAATIPAHLQLARAADIFHAHTFACGVPPMVTRLRHRRPFVLTLHTSHFLARARRPTWRPILRRIIGAADYLLATSEEILRVALRLYPHPRAQVMTNAVDTDRFAPADGGAAGRGTRRGDGPRGVIVPRRLFPKNGVEYFIRAVPLMAQRADVAARIVGDGPERDRLEALARELGVSDRVEFLGARPNDEMPGLLRDAELAVIPSLVEATSIAALEAMACGLPVAASAVGGLPEIIDEGVGALFAPADPRALADAVVELLERPDLPELGREARRRVIERWSLERMVRRHIEIYTELLHDERNQEKAS
jgi:glycosyltransferase involved in cell wall biosynthesis